MSFLAAISQATITLRGRFGDDVAVLQAEGAYIQPVDMPIFLFGLLSLLLVSGAVCVALEVRSEQQDRT